MNLPNRMGQMLRYVGTGGTAAAVDLGGFALLLAISLPLVVAGTLSFLVAVLVNFCLSSRYVFQVPISLRRFPTFALGATVGLVVNMGMTLFITSIVGTPTLGKAIGIATAFFVNYSINVLFVYRP